ncbi:MAG: hypoxanthine phosphoribosyltransferase [Acidimicrobiales bacterium]|nr:hypoxanthine phosphoribosyltransferase [Acidimicrobiales bacterium]
MVTAATDGLDLLADAAELHRQVARIAAAIDAEHPEGVTLVGVLKGSVLFLADLARRVRVPVRIELVAVAPYDGARTRTRVIKDLDRSVAGERVVLVAGIVDTGLTADFLLRHLRAAEPSSLQVCALADKRARRLLPVPVDHIAIDAPDRFLVGYGLDYAGRYRNVADLWCGDGEALAADPDRYITRLYGVHA